MQNSYDLVIIGGGLVGASLAASLRNSALRVALVETVPWTTLETSTSYDDKVLALSYSSQRIFAGMGLWSTLAPHTTPIEQIHVSDQYQFGFARLNSRLLGLPALGYVVRARQVGHVLQTALSSSTTTIFAPAALIYLTLNTSDAVLTLDIAGQRQHLRTRLLVAADGAQSKIRHFANFAVQEYDYQQNAIITNVTVQSPQLHTAYERFTPSGPLALLPLAENDYSLVWTVQRAEVERILALEPTEFSKNLQQHFGWRLGRFLRSGQRQAYPLQLISVQQPVSSRVVVIGNAAHTLHPIAGQGFNLGLRDVAHLAEVITHAHHSGQDIGALTTLEQYAARQQPDQQRVTYLTDGLVKTFSNTLPPLVITRNLGLLLLDSLPALKKHLILQMAGLNSYPSRLVRGLPLS